MGTNIAKDFILKCKGFICGKGKREAILQLWYFYPNYMLYLKSSLDKK